MGEYIPLCRSLNMPLCTKKRSRTRSQVTLSVYFCMGRLCTESTTNVSVNISVSLIWYSTATTKIWSPLSLSLRRFVSINAEQVYAQFYVYLYLCQWKCNHMSAINTCVYISFIYKECKYNLYTFKQLNWRCTHLNVLFVTALHVLHFTLHFCDYSSLRRHSNVHFHTSASSPLTPRW